MDESIISGGSQGILGHGGAFIQSTWRFDVETGVKLTKVYSVAVKVYMNSMVAPSFNPPRDSM